MTLRDVIRNLLYPPRCRLCGALCGWEEQVCPACREQLPQAGEFFPIRGGVPPGDGAAEI